MSFNANGLAIDHCIGNVAETFSSPKTVPLNSRSGRKFSRETMLLLLFDADACVGAVISHLIKCCQMSDPADQMKICKSNSKTLFYVDFWVFGLITISNNYNKFVFIQSQCLLIMKTMC